MCLRACVHVCVCVRACVCVSTRKNHTDFTAFDVAIYKIALYLLVG